MGLGLNVGEQYGGVAFLGYRRYADGTMCQAEIRNLVRKYGDIIIAVNGRSTVKKTFKEIIPMLRESSTFAYMRLVHHECMVDGGFTTSCGALGSYLYDDLSAAFRTDRRRLLAKRSLALIRAEAERDGESTSSDDAADGLDDDSDSDESVDIEPDSEDEALLKEKTSSSDESYHSTDDSRSIGNAPSEDASDADEIVQSQGVTKESEEMAAEKERNEIIEAPELESVIYKQESTRHLAYRVLGVDVGYSSDEGGDEDVAYYVSSKHSGEFFFRYHVAAAHIKMSLTAFFSWHRLMALTALSLVQTRFRLNPHSCYQMRTRQWMMPILPSSRNCH